MRSPVIKTARLTLRPFRYSDIPDVFTLCSEPETSRYALWEPHTSYIDSFKYIYWTHRKSQGIHWAIECDSTVIGSCSYVKLDAGGLSGEIGYSIHPSRWGKGYATEAAEAIIKHGFTQLGLSRVYVRIMLLNTRSLAVARRLNMQKSDTDERFVISRGVKKEITVLELKKENM